MLAATLSCQVLLATAAFAIPTRKERFAERIARRSGGLPRQSLPKQATGHISNVSHVEYSSNWAGAVISETTVCCHGSLSMPAFHTGGSADLPRSIPP